MASWLSGIDPNLVATILSAMGAGIVWLYHRAKGDSISTADDLVTSILANISHELLDEYNGEELSAYLDKARARFEELIWTILLKRGIKKSSLLEPVVHLGVERASAWLAGQLLAKGNQLALGRIPDQLLSLQQQAKDILKTIEDAQAKSFADGKKFADDMVEKSPVSDNQFYALITVLGAGLAAIGAAIRFSVMRIVQSLDINSSAMLENTKSNAVLSTKIDAIAGYVQGRSKVPSNVKEFIREEVSAVHDIIGSEDETPQRVRVKTDARGVRVKRSGTKGDGEV